MEPAAKAPRLASPDVDGVTSRLEDFAEGVKTLNVPPVPQAVKKELARYRCVRHGTMFEAWLGPQMLIRTKFGNTNQLHLVAGPAGYRKQLTFEKEPVCATRRIPGTANFIFSMDEGGDEYFKYFYFDSTAEISDRCMSSPSDLKKKVSQVPFISKTGNRLAYSINKRGKEFDIYCATLPPAGSDVSAYESLLEQAVPLAQTSDSRESLHPEDWSPDGSHLIVSITRGTSESRLAIVDVQMGLDSAGLKGLRLLPIDGNTAYSCSDPLVCEKAGDDAIRFSSAKWLKDGSVLFLGDGGSEFLSLRLWSEAEGLVHITTPELGTVPQAHDVVDFQCHLDTGMVCYSLNEDGLISLQLLDLANRSSVMRIPDVMVGKVTLGKFTDDGRGIAYTVDSIQCPGDVFVYDVKDGTTTRWTFSETGPVKPHLFVSPTRLHYPTFDAPRKIPCWVYRPPASCGRAAPYPVVIYIHGGPALQIFPTFRPANHPQCNQVLLDNGIAVLAPDVRGSAGYGKTFKKLDDWELREDSVKDIGALIEWVKTQPDLDKDRICIMGRSYGGYMTLKCMQLYSDRIRCGVDTCGMSSLLSFLETIPAWRRDLRRPEYGDERLPHIREWLIQDAPLSNTHRMGVPALILQGERDIRVPLSETVQMFRALEDKGLSPWLFVATHEGHIFQKKDVIDAASEIILTFIKEQLLKA